MFPALGFLKIHHREQTQPNNIDKLAVLARPFYRHLHEVDSRKLLPLGPEPFYLAAMSHLIAISVTLTILFSQTVVGQSKIEGSYFWPLKIHKKLSSGFGDIRPGRFHMGIDLRTNGEEGAKVYAPEDGYVWRLKTSYTGYGKALYIKGLSGRIYVFGHLQKYNWDIGTYLREMQIETGRYYQDFHLDEGRLPIKKGEFIARTGQSGAGAPHLHFEIRNALDQPTNPLYYNVGLNDKRAPKFEAVWLSCLDDSTLYQGGEREIKLLPRYNKNTNRYFVSDTVSINGRFAVKAAIGDYFGKGSFTLGPAYIRLMIDGVVYHEIDFDRLDFSENIYSILDRDSDPRKAEYKRVFNLFRKPGTRLANYKSEIAGNGSFSDTLDGFHTVLIEATDAQGNTGHLEFVFYYFMAGEILAPHNRADFTDTLLTFTYGGSGSRAAFDSLELILSGGQSKSDTMQVILAPQIQVDDNAVTLDGEFGQTTEYRLQFYNNDRPYPADYFSTEKITPSGKSAVDSVSADVIDNGILITAIPFSAGINWLQAEIVTDIGSDRLFYRKTGDQRFSLFYSPAPEVSEINAIITRGPVGFRPDTLSLSAYPVKSGRITTIALKPESDLLIKNGIIFDDVILAVRDTVMPPPLTGYYVHEPFIFGPETVSFADWADLQTKIPKEKGAPEKMGLYVHHPEKGWLWAGGSSSPETGIMHSRLGGAGVLAIIADTAAPVVSKLNIGENGFIKSDRPEILFTVDDELSGMENDTNFNITINGKWMVPEYDPERKTFKSIAHWRPGAGKHVLRIEIQDRCGNRALLTRNFTIKSKTGP